MEAVDMDAGRYELRECLPGSSVDSDASSSLLGSNDVSEHSDKTSDDEEDLREDLQKTIPECYKSDSNFASHSTKNITNDDEFQATALCQFMDILNDLDEVLDKSLLACLDDTQHFDSDEDDIICKLKDCVTNNEQQLEDTESESSMDNTQVVIGRSTQSLEPHLEDMELVQNLFEQPQCTSMRRSKSYSELPQNHTNAQQLERANTMNDNLRNSMRRLDPIVLPALDTESVCEPLTLPVILFLEHHVNMRPTSAPLQLQVTTANLSTSSGSSGPIIVGRRALLMNRALSLPSPGDSDITNTGWNGPNGRSIARSTSSTSSSSGESLAGIAAMNQNGAETSDERNEETEEPPIGVWPHRMSSMLACLSCTVGIFNISRFSVFSVHYGACFILQFFILSLFTGIPLFTLHLCLGHVLQSGPIDMWRISPIFKGVGVSLLLTQAVIGMYSVISLSWIFVYLRDSFITSDDKYKWALPLGFSFDDINLKNSTFKIEETLPQYFHGEVLQRGSASNNHFGSIKYQVALYLAVVWIIVFVALSKGLRSYGKAVYVLMFLPICGTLVLCTKLLTLIPYDSVTNIFSETEWTEFFLNSNSWAAAAQETFLTWGLLGACVMQLTSHGGWGRGRGRGRALRQSGYVIACTFAVLLLAACLANTCVRILKNNGYIFLPSSFETIKSSQFLWSCDTSPGGVGSVGGVGGATPVRYLGQYGSLVGVSVWRGGTAAKLYSGWQPLQLATQIVPATLAVVPPNVLSPAWAVIFFLTVLLFGVAQQLAIWHCVISGLMATHKHALHTWQTTITFFSCVLGFSMGLLLSTDAGIRVVHLVDYVWVGAWWQCAVQVALSAAVFAVRGRPYSADAVAAALYRPPTPLAAPLAALLAFTWSVLLPVLLCAICIMDFRIGQQRQLYSWRKPIGYFPIWARQVAVMMQQGALLTVPLVAFIQTWRYMNKGPTDILERIQNLYRPRMGGASERPPPAASAPPPAPRAPPDPPPKYTPPPSYSTATGARLITTLRRSFRTLRRITSGRTDAPVDDTAQIAITVSESVDRPPPTTTIPQPAPSLSVTDETDRRTSRNSLTLTRDYLRRSFVRKTDSTKSIRSSLRRSFKYGVSLTTSHEQLVGDAEPISNTVAMSAMLGEGSPPHTRSLGSVI